jgi:hypothetical protein
MHARFFLALIAAVAAFQNCEVVAHEAGSNRSRSQLPDRLQVQESADLALAAGRAEADPPDRKRGLGLDFQGITSDSHFYVWMVIPSGSQGFEYFSVDRRTGDVWFHLGCTLVRSRELAIRQARFRRRFNVPAQQVQQIEKEGLPNEGCDQ